VSLLVTQIALQHYATNEKTTGYDRDKFGVCLYRDCSGQETLMMKLKIIVSILSHHLKRPRLLINYKNNSNESVFSLENKLQYISMSSSGADR
jgi:hypothetical protein